MEKVRPSLVVLSVSLATLAKDEIGHGSGIVGFVSSILSHP